MVDHMQCAILQLDLKGLEFQPRGMLPSHAGSCLSHSTPARLITTFAKVMHMHDISFLVLDVRCFVNLVLAIELMIAQMASWHRLERSASFRGQFVSAMETARASVLWSQQANLW